MKIKISKKLKLKITSPNYGNSFLVLSKVAVYHYKQTEYYLGMRRQFTYKWNDLKINLKLNKKEITLSKRDL